MKPGDRVQITDRAAATFQNTRSKIVWKGRAGVIKYITWRGCHVIWDGNNTYDAIPTAAIMPEVIERISSC